MNTTELEKKLNHLIERNYDAEKGFKQVVKGIEHEGFQSIMDKSIQERYRFGHEIKAIMSDLGMKPEKGSSVEGDLHRAWMNIRDIFSTNNDAAMLDEAIRGETHALDAYTDIIKTSNLQKGHNDILLNHTESIQSTITDLKTLKSIASPHS